MSISADESGAAGTSRRFLLRASAAAAGTVVAASAVRPRMTAPGGDRHPGSDAGVDGGGKVF